MIDELFINREGEAFMAVEKFLLNKNRHWSNLLSSA